MRTTFSFEKVVTDRVPWRAEVICLRCRATVLVTRGTVAAVMRCGNEWLGVTCDRCLAPGSRETLAQLRGQKVAAHDAATGLSGGGDWGAAA